MIPKKIHYCWFGNNAKPKVVEKCISSWKKKLPDYEIIEWNESNFDVNHNAYTKMCYENKKFAFLTDYLRLLIIYEHGGIYFDTDVEVIRSFDDLLCEKGFFGFENDSHVASGLGFGAEKGNTIVKKMLSEYDPLLDGLHGTVGCPILNTKALVEEGLKLDGTLQRINGVLICPSDYFNPMNSATGEIKKTRNTYSIHRYSMLWLPKHKRIKSSITKVFHRFFGVDCFRFLKR